MNPPAATAATSINLRAGSDQYGWCAWNAALNLPPAEARCCLHGMPVVSWHRFKELETYVIVIIEMPGRDEGRERVNRYVARSRAKHLLMVIEVEEA